MSECERENNNNKKKEEEANQPRSHRKDKKNYTLESKIGQTAKKKISDKDAIKTETDSYPSFPSISPFFFFF